MSKAALDKNALTATAYQELAQVTKSNTFFGEYIAIDALIDAINECLIAANALDKLKKLAFYGRGASDAHKPEGHNSLAVLQMTGLDETLLHSLIGGHTETAEQLEILRDWLTAAKTSPAKMPEWPAIKIMEELGGAYWYGAIAQEAMGLSFEHVFGLNIAQLKARFGDRFDAAAANKRDLENERAVMSAVSGIKQEEGFDRTITDAFKVNDVTADDEVARFSVDDELLPIVGETGEQYEKRVAEYLGR